MFKTSTVSVDLNLSEVNEHLYTSFTGSVQQSFVNEVQVTMNKSDDASNDILDVFTVD